MNYSSVTNNIKSLIKEKGLLQKSVAQKAGIEEKAFSNMLNGRKVIDANDIYNISMALCVLPNDLFGFGSSERERK